MDFLLLVLLITFIVWLVTLFAPGLPPWGSKLALAIVLGCLVLLAWDVHVGAR